MVWTGRIPRAGLSLSSRSMFLYSALLSCTTVSTVFSLSFNWIQGSYETVKHGTPTYGTYLPLNPAISSLLPVTMPNAEKRAHWFFPHYLLQWRTKLYCGFSCRVMLRKPLTQWLRLRIARPETTQHTTVRCFFVSALLRRYLPT